MKKKIFLTILIIFVSVIAAMAVWQWDNITAVIDGIKYDEQQLNEKKDTEIKKVDDYFEQNNLNKVTPLTQEQEQALQNGEITETDAIDIMMGKITLEEAKEKNLSRDNTDRTDMASSQEHSHNEKAVSGFEDKVNGSLAGSGNASKPKNETKPVAPDKSSDADSKYEAYGSQSPIDYDSLISIKVAELYILKSNFYSSFNAKYTVARSKFLALPKSEQTKANLAAAVRSYMSVGLAMEKDCDAQVEAILTELTSLLSRAGRDLSLVQAIRNAYNSEKSSFKSRLISKYF